MFAVTGLGKSLLALDIAAAMATGRSVLGLPGSVPACISYFDLEMTRADLHDRLADLGYGADSDLSRLHYYQLPDLPPLDTAEGGETLMRVVERDRPTLVIIDTMARVVEGDENSADTYRDFFRCSGIRLKAAGVSLLRLDHAGKDASRGQRGSS
jgi:RecA-family ATPase